MEFKVKRRFSFAVIVIFMFMDGVEYAVVFPTLWEYLRKLGIPDEDVYYLGLCISALTVTDMFAGLVVGRLLDRVSNVSTFLLSLNVFQVGASALYLFAQSPAWVLASRLIAGIGNVSTVALMTDVCRSTTLKERTPILVGFNIAQQVGLLFGPACNLLLREINITFESNSFVIDKLNAPGLFMGIFYLIFEGIVAIMYFDLAKEYAKEQRRSGLHQQVEEEGGGEQSHETEIPPHQTGPAALTNTSVGWSEYKEELVRGEIVALMFLRLIGLLGQTCFETIVTPMMSTYFNYGDFENSILYLLGGIELVFVSIAITWISGRVQDRSFILVGVVLHIFTLAWFLLIMPGYRKGDRGNLWSFGVAVFLDLLSITIMLNMSLSLLTKLVKSEVHGFATGVRRFFSNLALMLGPLWGGGALPWLRVLFAVPLVLLSIGTVLFLHSYSDMIPRNEAAIPARGVQHDEQREEDELEAEDVPNDEEVPLLGHVTAVTC